MSDERFPREASDHARFDELAAGYALDALEADDEAEFRAHLEHCSRCQILVEDFDEATAELASALPGATAPVALRDEILTAARQTPHHAAEIETRPQAVPPTSPPISPLVIRPRRTRSRLLIAAAAVVIVIGGVLGGVLASQGGLGAPPAKCTASVGCTEVTLTSVQTHHAVARLIVANGSVWLRPLGLSPDQRTREIYVLWQIEGAHAPRAIGGFDVVAGHHGTVPIGALIAPRRAGTEFAVSLEPGRQVPRVPTHVVAVQRLA